MKTARVAKVVCVAGLAAACMCSAFACSSNDTAEGLTGGVAATVNGAEIAEDDVTTTIQNIRSANSLDDQDAWGEYLAGAGLTPESVRENIINSLVQEELVKQGAEERGVTVEDSEVDSYVSQIKANYDSDDKWKQALQQAGFEDENAYRENVKDGLTYNKLMDSFEVDDPTDDEVVAYAADHVSQYDGAKRSSHILFSINDQETAQSVLDQLNAGEIDFADAAEQYSTDTASAQKGGDVGWDKLTTFVDEYQNALDELEVGQISGLVESDYGYHIIKCTDEFTAPEEVTSLDQLPSEIVDALRSADLQQKKQEAYSDWFTEYKDSADIVINDMPEGLPYAVDMSQYETDDGSDDASADASADDASADDAATDGAGEETSGDAADGDASEGASADEGSADDVSSDDQAADAA